MINYEQLTQEQSAEIAQFLIDNFFRHEPFGLALGLTIDQVTRWFPTFLHEFLGYSVPMSFLARDSDSGKIAGVIVNIIVDPALPPPPNMKSFLDPAKEPVKMQIVTFLEDLEEGVDAAESLGQPKESKIFACLFLSVSDEFGGKGIARELVDISEKKAKETPGVTIALTDVTSAFSYKVFTKLGYKVIKEVEYQMYKDHDGVSIFENKQDKLGVHTHARVVTKLL